MSRLRCSLFVWVVVWFLLGAYCVAQEAPVAAGPPMDQEKKITALEAQVKNLQAAIQSLGQQVKQGPAVSGDRATTAKDAVRQLTRDEPWCHAAGGRWVVWFDRAGKPVTTVCQLQSR